MIKDILQNFVFPYGASNLAFSSSCYNLQLIAEMSEPVRIKQLLF